MKLDTDLAFLLVYNQILFIIHVSTSFSPDILNVVNVLNEIVSHHFSSCDLYLTTDVAAQHFNPNQLHPSFPQLLNKVSTFSTNFSTLIFQLHSFKNLPNNSSNSSDKNCSVVSCMNIITRKYSHCTLSINIYNRQNANPTSLINFVVSPFLSPLKNDQDYFIFLLGSLSKKLIQRRLSQFVHSV